MKTDYPKRSSHHAHKLTRLLFKSCAAQDIGHQAICLVIHIAHTEDAARYQGPVRFWNSQLMEVLGFNSPKQLTAARDRAVNAGWLVYRRDNDRTVGHYWTCTPASVTKFDDEPIEPVDSIHSESGTRIHSEIGKHSENGTGIHSESGTQSGMHCGTHSGMHCGMPSYPTPNPDPNPMSTIEIADAVSLVCDTKTPKFTDADLETAKWMFSLIVAKAPKTEKPNLKSWASQIRLLREKTSSTDGEVRAAFAWANHDEEFWAMNVRSPSSLRKNFAKFDAEARRAAPRIENSTHIAAGPAVETVKAKKQRIASQCREHSHAQN